MKLNILGFAVPIFLLFMLIEFLVARAKKRPYFRLDNSLANISVGIAERLQPRHTGIYFRNALASSRASCQQ
jgi:alkylglycerol monooxygenase